MFCGIPFILVLRNLTGTVLRSSHMWSFFIMVEISLTICFVVNIRLTAFFRVCFCLLCASLLSSSGLSSLSSSKGLDSLDLRNLRGTRGSSYGFHEQPCSIMLDILDQRSLF